MTRGGRALLGAMLGAALTLLIHPASRPYIFSAFISPSHPRAAPQKDIPNDVVELSSWMTAVADRYVAHQRLTPIELKNAIAAAEHGTKLDPDNAYWHQMLACLQHRMGDEAEGLRHWKIGAACDTWNDYQSVELLRERNRLAADFCASQS